MTIYDLRFMIFFTTPTPEIINRKSEIISFRRFQNSCYTGA